MTINNQGAEKRRCDTAAGRIVISEVRFSVCPPRPFNNDFTMKTKTLFHRTLKNGVELEIAAGIYKPLFRDKKNGRRREFTLDVIPCVSYASSDHNWGYEKDNVCQTTLYIGWLIFYVYFETFRPVRGTAKPWR